MHSGADRRAWMLKEIGVEYRHAPTDFQSGATRDPSFLEINPNGRVPVLDDDGFVLFESLAINLHLARKFGGMPVNSVRASRPHSSGTTVACDSARIVQETDMAIDPRSLRILLAVHRAGSFTGAAQDLAMSQPSISVAIRQLEDRIGIEIVRRDRKGAELTDAGLLLVGRAAAIENILTQAEREVAGRRERSLGPLRIAGTPGALLALLPPCAAALRAQEPRFVIEAAEAKDEDLIPMLRGRSIDLALCTATGEAVAPDIEQNVLRREPFCLVCRKSFLPDVDELTIAEAARLAWVMPLAQGATRRQLEAVFLAVGIGLPQTVVRCDALATMKEMVEAADFLMLLPAAVVRAELQRGAFHQIRLANAPPPRSLGVMRLSESDPTPAMIAFIEAARESAAAP